MILYGYISAFAYGIICLLSAAVLYRLGLPKIFTRKFVHILVGFEWVILYIFHGPTGHFFTVCLAFLALLVFVAWKKLMPMISSDSDNALGTVYYAVSMSIMAFICIFIKELIIPFGIAVFCTSFGDGFAGVIGQAVKKHNPKIYGNKSLFGTLANLLFSAATVVIFKFIFELDLSVAAIIIIAVFAVELEIFTGYGLDNITLPLGVFSITSIFLLLSDPLFYVVPFLLTPIIIAIVSKKHLLSSAGIFAAFLIDIIISVSLGNFGFTVLFLFFALGVVTDKIKKRAKGITEAAKAEHCRDHTQVLANAIVAAFFALTYQTTGKFVFAVGFAASLAEALADTASSSFGAFSRTTVDIFKFRKCKKGLSGGVSIYGTLAALVSSAFMGGVCVLFGFGLEEFLIITASAFLGTVFDSLLGSLFQIKYKCSVCGEVIERDFHCEAPAERYSGIKHFTNDLVNLLSTAFSAILAVILFIFL